MKQYIQLSQQERHSLQRLRHDRDGNVARRALALLWLDEGHTKTEVTQRLGISRQTLDNWLQQFVADRDDLDVAMRLQKRHGGGHSQVRRQKIKGYIRQYWMHSPQMLGYPQARWTVPLFQQYLAKQDMDACQQSIRQALHELGYVWKDNQFVLCSSE